MRILAVCIDTCIDTMQTVGMTATVTLRLATVADLRDLANRFEARIAADANDTSARYELDLVNGELTRRQRLCRTEHPDPASYAVCALLDGHTGDHLSLTHGRRW